jgi:hypothetical protein
MDANNTIDNTAPQPSEITQRILEQLPHLIGAIDTAIMDASGTKERLPFMLLIFNEGGAMHAQNFDQAIARRAVLELAANWASADDLDAARAAGVEG